MMAQPPTNSTPRGLRLLLFGPSGAGKSSLLGALAQVDSAKAVALKGDLVDDSGKLEALRRYAYSGTTTPTAGEVVAYPVHFEPQEGGKPITATLLDSDGRQAEPYLSGDRPLRRDSGPLADAMLGADTVILAVDASLPADRLEAQLVRFRSFLELLREVRGKRADVADLPVYLVLTKCDKLAKPGEGFAPWVLRVEETQNRLGQRFRDLLAASVHDTAFGSLDLHLWATATRRPGSDSKAPEPFGVAELFRQCLDSAAGYQRRRGSAVRRLGVTAVALAGLLAALGTLGGLFFTMQPDPDSSRLEEQARLVLAAGPDAPAAERLRGPLDERLKQAEAVVQDPGFAGLPNPLRDRVTATRAELAAYVGAGERFQEQVKKPYLAKNEAEFAKLAGQAEAFRLPPAYADAWKETRLVRRLEQVRDEYRRVRQAAAAEEAWTRERLREGKALLRQGYGILQQDEKAPPSVTDAWFTALRDHLQARVRVPGHERIPGVTALSYGDLVQFRAVRQAREEWQAVKDELAEVHGRIERRIGK